MSAIQFETYPDRDGYLRDPSVLLDGPIAPGTCIIKVPVVRGINLRFGVIVGVHSGQVDVMWHRWASDDSIQDGELRQRLGIPNARQRRELKRQQWEAKKRERYGQQQ